LVTSDAPARRDAVDPTRNVVLEASAGTGKTRVLVDRYVNLLLAGVDPHNILAITFTRKAAAEMRQRVIERLRDVGWRPLHERISDIEISTIDAFCLSLLREFPLEADVDPGFDLADDTEVNLSCPGARRRGGGTGVRRARRATSAGRAGRARRSSRRGTRPAAPFPGEGPEGSLGLTRLSGRRPSAAASVRCHP
jgi:hypothetical protein